MEIPIYKQRNLSMVNIDDYIRQRKLFGAKSIIWGKHGLKIFYKFLKMSYKIPKNEIHGLRFLGLKHYIRNN